MTCRTLMHAKGSADSNKSVFRTGGPGAKLVQWNDAPELAPVLPHRQSVRGLCQSLAPLVLRELMAGSRTFNDIQRGVPLISRAVLVSRLRELENEGIIERRARGRGAGHEYWLTPAGDAFRAVISELGHWGLAHARDRLTREDLDPTVLLWGFRKRSDRHALPDRRIVVRFEFSGVPTSRTRFRLMWLLLERTNVDVCVKDPGFPVDLTMRGNIRDFVAIYLGHVLWREVAGKSLIIEGKREFARRVPSWIRLDQVVGKDFPIVRPAA
jgi:DNA-binding HxlR family transcriptional regulator